jgi:hypothetical protein
MSALIYVPPQELRAAWKQIKPAVQDIWAACGEPWLVEDVYAALVTGAAQLWRRPDGSGWVVLKITQEPYSGEPMLLVWLAWSAPGTEEVVAANAGQVREIARAAGVKRLVFESPRRGWERRGPALGWRAVYTHFEMEV